MNIKEFIRDFKEDFLALNKWLQTALVFLTVLGAGCALIIVSYLSQLTYITPSADSFSDPRFTYHSVDVEYFVRLDRTVLVKERFNFTLNSPLPAGPFGRGEDYKYISPEREVSDRSVRPVEFVINGADPIRVLPNERFSLPELGIGTNTLELIYIIENGLRVDDKGGSSFENWVFTDATSLIEKFKATIFIPKKLIASEVNWRAWVSQQGSSAWSFSKTVEVIQADSKTKLDGEELHAVQISAVHPPKEGENLWFEVSW